MMVPLAAQVRPLAVAAAVVFAGVPLAFAAAVGAWSEHRNARFGFALAYPSDIFVAERTSQAGDGQVFVSRDGKARLLVGAFRNDMGLSPAGYQDYIARHSYGDYSIAYRPLGASWFVLSGEGRGNVFYEKVMFSCSGRLLTSFVLLYASDARDTFDPIVQRIAGTFKPGRDCEHAGLSAPAQPAPPRRRIAEDERARLADRIARARGHDVLVVLRRTSWPYEYKVVRGYASRP